MSEENQDKQGKIEKLNEEDLDNSDRIYQSSQLETQTETFVDMGDDVEYATKPEVDGYDGTPSHEDAHEHFEKHFSAFLAGISKNIDYFEPAYYYGFEMAVSDEHESDLIVEAEERLQSGWEETNPDTWETYNTAILHGWKIGYSMTHKVEIEDPRGS